LEGTELSMTDEEIESGRSVTEEEREDPTRAPGAGMTEDDRSAQQTPLRGDQGPGGAKEQDTTHPTSE
jgi:hypothetical protein